MNCRHLTLLVVLSVVLIFYDFTAAESVDVCRVFSNNTQIRDPEFCNKYITCIDFVSHNRTCNASTPFYDKDTNKCVKALTDSTCVSCVNNAEKFVRDPKSCHNSYFCEDEETPIHKSCPKNFTFFEEETQTCLDKMRNCHVDQFDFCALIKNGVNFRDEKHCGKYFQCIKGNLTSKECPGQYYNAATGKCMQKSQVKCDEHPKPKDVCGTDKKPKHFYLAGDGATCNGYFFCSKPKSGGADKNPKWSQCEPNKFFNEKKQHCVDPTTMVCKEDRCSGRTQTFVSSGKKGCHFYLYCKDGITVEELNCGRYFFDEKKGACVKEVKIYPSCMNE